MTNDRPSVEDFWAMVRTLVGETVYSLVQQIPSHPIRVSDIRIEFSDKEPVPRWRLVEQYEHLRERSSLRTDSGIPSIKSGDIAIIHKALGDRTEQVNNPVGIVWKIFPTKENSRSDWSPSEISFIVADYFDMLRAELAGEQFNKTAHRKALRLQLNGRSDGSVEFKHCNISTVLRDLDLTYIDGYKPRENKQQALSDAVEEYLKQFPDVAHNVALGPDESYDPFDILEPVSDDPSERIWQSIKARRGQKDFRIALSKLYGETCAITGHGPKDVLEAAHIQPHSVDGRNSIDNGLLLRADIHTLFDLNLISVEPKTLKIVISSQLEGSPYVDLKGRLLRKRTNDSRPSDFYLAEHFAKFKIRQ